MLWIGDNNHGTWTGRRDRERHLKRPIHIFTSPTHICRVNLQGKVAVHITNSGRPQARPGSETFGWKRVGPPPTDLPQRSDEMFRPTWVKSQWPMQLCSGRGFCGFTEHLASCHIPPGASTKGEDKRRASYAAPFPARPAVKWGIKPPSPSLRITTFRLQAT